MREEINKLNLVIDKIDRISDEEWKNTLNDRKIKELQFHDKDRDENIVNKTVASDTYEKFYGNKKYYKITKRSSLYVKNWIKRSLKTRFF